VDRRLVPAPVAVSIVGTFAILLLGALFYARSFVLPIVLALLVTLTFAPLVRWLARRGIPAPATAVLLVVLLGAVMGLALAFLIDPVSRILAQAPDVIRQAREQVVEIGRQFAFLSEGSGGAEAAAGNGAADPDNGEQIMAFQPGAIVAWVAGTLAGIGTTFGATLILSFFLLASGDVLRQKALQMFDSLSDKKRSLAVLNDIESEVSRYLLTISGINTVFGACVGMAMYALGMPDPVLWGLAAALLNFVPYLGGLVGITLMTAVSITTFDTLPATLAPPIAYLALQFVESSLITPMILGRRLELHIVAILIFLAFTTWMWGIVGTVIGVPLLVVVKVVSDNSPGLVHLSSLLSAENGGVRANTQIPASEPGNKAPAADV
jgi:predicted PurR-regulated permease PerM